MKSKILEPGQKFNRLTVIKLDHIKHTSNKYQKNINREFYLCKCDCGNECIVEKKNLTCKCRPTISCGCLIKEIDKQEPKHIIHNLSKSRLWGIWQNMKNRCYNKNNISFINYGNRGIIMCKEWKNNFINFHDWAINNGYKENLSIDRIDINGNYEPSNCRWVSMKEQARNKRNNVIIKHNNQEYIAKDYCDMLNINYKNFLKKIKMAFLDTITTQTFRDYFTREFNYLIIWDEETTYNKNDIVYYSETKLFYQSLINGNVANVPSENIEDWEEIEDDYNNYINDNDILKAFGQAKNMININLFKNNLELLKICYLLLSAHYLIVDLNMSQGNGASGFMMTSKTVDGVSATYGIPQSLLNSPLFSYIAKTEFGLKYIQYIMPMLNGYNRCIIGTTSIL